VWSAVVRLFARAVSCISGAQSKWVMAYVDADEDVDAVTPVP